MARFVFQARESNGETATGVLTAQDVREAARLLRKDGKIVVSLKQEVDEDIEQLALAGGRKRVKRDDVIFFAAQLAVLVDTGVPLAESLDCIARGTDHTGMKALVQDLSERVKGGTEFSAALERYPKVFDNLFVSLVRASEASGTMGPMLQRISEYLEQERETRKKVKGAMTYPILMLSFCMVVVLVLLIFVLPRFEKLYAGRNAVLPLPTRALLGFSHTLIANWYIFVGALVLLVGGLAYYLHTQAGKVFLARLSLNMPVLGPMARKGCIARSLRTLATMVASGVNMLDCLYLAGEVSGNYFYKQMWSRLAERAKEGAMLSEELFNEPLVPATVTQMISAGERTGQLSHVMDRAAHFCETDLKTAIKSVTDLIEPIMIIIMGLIVGGIAMALLLPVFRVSRLMAA